MRGLWGDAKVWLFFAAIGLIVFAVFLITGPPLAHSYMLDLNWSSAFAEQFWDGDLYPRWLFGLNLGAGSPSFYFYGPLPFWFNAIFGALLCPGCDPGRWLMAGPSALLALSGISFYYWARLYSRPVAALAAAVLYVFLPYHFAIDLWIRLALGEFATYVWMPVILLGLAKAQTSGKYLALAAIGYGALLYSHLPGALLFSPVMVGFVVTHYGVFKGPRLLIAPVVLGLGVAALYLVPALTTQDTINVSAWWTRDPHNDPLNWLWLDGRPAPPFAGVVGVALLVPSMLGALMIGGLMHYGKGRSPITLFLVLSFVYAWFLMTYPSTLLWEHVDLLRKVQFPWRVGIVVDICAATLFAIWLEWTLTQKKHFKESLYVALIIISGYYVGNLNRLSWFQLETFDERVLVEVREIIADGRDAMEYRPIWSVQPGEKLGTGAFTEKLRAIAHASIVAGEGTVSIDAQEVDRLAVTVEAITPVRLRFRRFYYPGWRLTAEPSGAEVVLEPSADMGLIEAQVPSGSHRLSLTRHPIREERIGAAVSAVSLIGVLSLLVPGFLRRRRLHGKPST